MSARKPAREPFEHAEVMLARRGDRFREIDVPVFGDPETIKVADLAVGDFVVEFPRQAGIRGKVISSAVASLAETYDRWTAPNSPRPRSKRHSVRSRKVTFADRSIVPIDVPISCEIVVRRPKES